MARVARLLLTLGPVAALYPLHRYLLQDDENEGGDAGDGFVRACVRHVERSGAVVIKLLQWASSRPDLFGKAFCDTFQNLQDNTTPHSWRHTCEVMEKAYGSDWRERIRLDKVIGSGCIGQVYKGEVVDRDGERKVVAVKVTHPGVRDDVDVDLDLLRFLVRIVDRLPYGLRWLNLKGMAEEFADMLKVQLDLRTEAKNLERFNANFSRVDEIEFPKLVPGYDAHPDVLVESFCEGVPVRDFVAQRGNDDPSVCRRLSEVGVRGVCKMIFEDNFLHADLHPGNVLVSPCGTRMFLLDAGLATEYAPRDHDLLVGILTSFVREDGRRAGRLMIAEQRRNDTEDYCVVDEKGYVDKIEAMVKGAYSDEKDHLMKELGSYISYICESAATHHVMMNQAFVTICLAVKVQEGVARMLDPTVSICNIANPIILRTDLKRRIVRFWERTKGEMENLLAPILSLGSSMIADGSNDLFISKREQ